MKNIGTSSPVVKGVIASSMWLATAPRGIATPRMKAPKTA